jgi:HK97 family phage portal protein
VSLARRLVNPPERRATSAGRGVIESGNAAIPPPYDWLVNEHLVAPVNDIQAMRCMTVYACIRILADIIASLPWYVYRDSPEGFPVRLNPQPKIVTKPCPDLTCFDWKFMQVVSLCLRGNSFNYITAFDSTTGWPTGLLPLHPDWVMVEVPPDYDWTHPIYRVGGLVVDPSRMLHVKRFVLPGWPEGLSPIQQAAQTIGMALHAQEYGYRYFRDTANPSGALLSDAHVPEPVAKQIQKDWIATHGGRRLPAMLSGGFKWQPITISPEESQFLATRGFQDNQIQRVFGIPPHMMGDHEKTSSWGTGIEQITIGFIQYTLNSWLVMFENALSDILLPKPQYLKFDVDELMRGDQQARWEAYTAARNAGALNADEIRAREGKPPIPGGKGKVYLQPVNYAPLGYDPAAAATAAATAHAATLAKGSGQQGHNEPQDGDEPTQEESGNAQPSQQAQTNGRSRDPA